MAAETVWEMDSTDDGRDSDKAALATALMLCDVGMV